MGFLGHDADRAWSALKAMESTLSHPNAPEVPLIVESMKVVDQYIPTPGAGGGQAVHDAGGEPSYYGRGTVVTGRVERGSIKVGDPIEIVGLRDTRQTVVTVEMFHKVLDNAESGGQLRGVVCAGSSGRY